MSIKTIAAVSALITASVIGSFQNATLPPWAWFVWAVLLVVAVTGWFVVSRSVTFAVRKAILIIPISSKVEPGGISMPVAEIHQERARIENEIKRMLRFRLLAWLAVRAFRMKAGELLGGIVDHCKTNGSEILDARLFSTWIHGKVADTLSETAGEVVSGFWQISVIVLACVGLVFAVPHFR